MTNLVHVSMPFIMFLISSKNSNWDVNLNTKAMLLPLLFASNQRVYYMPVMIYLIVSKRLFSYSLDITSRFVPTIKDGNSNISWPDYLLETTQNKSLKDIGRIIGLTMRPYIQVVFNKTSSSQKPSLIKGMRSFKVIIVQASNL